MDRQNLYLITLTLLNTIAVASLTALGEYRLDVYVSIYTLIYFTLTAIFRPRKRVWDFLSVILLIVFTYIVVMRI